MLNAKTRKVGNSIMISIPQELSPKPDKEYVVEETKNGAIIMTPKIKNPFKSSQKFETADDNKIFETASIKELFQ